jgi:hypothetical protein
MDGGIINDGAWMMMVFMEINVGASLLLVPFSSPFNCAMVVLVKIYGGGAAWWQGFTMQRGG